MKIVHNGRYLIILMLCMGLLITKNSMGLLAPEKIDCEAVVGFFKKMKCDLQNILTEVQWHLGNAVDTKRPEIINSNELIKAIDKQCGILSTALIVDLKKLKTIDTDTDQMKSESTKLTEANPYLKSFVGPTTPGDKAKWFYCAHAATIISAMANVGLAAISAIKTANLTVNKTALIRTVAKAWATPMNTLTRVYERQVGIICTLNTIFGSEISQPSSITRIIEQTEWIVKGFTE